MLGTYKIYFAVLKWHEQTNWILNYIISQEDSIKVREHLLSNTPLPRAGFHNSVLSLLSLEFIIDIIYKMRIIV